MTDTQLGWARAPMARVSTSNRLTSVASAASCAFRNFTATGRPSVSRSAWYTTPMAPSATRATTRYLPCSTRPIRGSPGAGGCTGSAKIGLAPVSIVDMVECSP